MTRPVSREDYELLEEILTSNGTGHSEIRWTDFLSLVKSLEFTVKTPGTGGSSHKFEPKAKDWQFDRVPLVVHKPHKSKFLPKQVLRLRRKMQRVYGWDMTSFVIKGTN